MAGREGPAADPQKQGSCPLSPDGAQQGRSCLWNYHWPEPGKAVITLRWSPCSLLKSLAHPRVGSVPLLPSPSTAEQPARGSWQGNTSSGAWGERSVPRQADTSREEGRQHTQLTQAWTPQPQVHMWAHSETETLSFPTHAHSHTHHPHTDACGAKWTHTDLHTPAAHPPSARVGGGSFAAHMEPRSSWAVPESGCEVGLGHLSQWRARQPRCAPHPAGIPTTVQ